MIIGVFANYGHNILGIRIDCCYILGMTPGPEYEWDTAVIDFDNNHPEPRWIATGFIGDIQHLVVYTERGDRIRIISLRKATPKEMRDYART